MAPADAARGVTDAPVIEKAVVLDGQLLIQGVRLGVKEPTVQLGGESPLVVTSFSPTEVVATLPAELGPGTYHLLYTRANGSVAEFFVNVPAPSCPRGRCEVTKGRACAFDRDCPAGEACRDPVPRFVHGNGTVTDLRTCLMWEKKTGTPGSYPSAPLCTSASVCPNPHDVNNLYRWGTLSSDVETVFLAQLNDAAFAGFTDWRLPTCGGGSHPTGEDPELESILYAPYPCVTAPCIDTTVFGPTFADFYWSSTPIGPSPPGPAFYVSFTTGGVGTAEYSFPNFARAVRRLR